VRENGSVDIAVIFLLSHFFGLYLWQKLATYPLAGAAWMTYALARLTGLGHFTLSGRCRLRAVAPPIG
jgi:hypothetical protein